jgi:hypothetical protein
MQKPAFMKVALMQLCFVILIISGLHAIKIMHSATIKGVVVQDDNVKDIWAVQGSDSTLVGNAEGAFHVNVKPGIWKIIIQPKETYKRITVLDRIEATEGQNIDLGEINLQ